MATILYSLAILACPVGMGLMMWVMMRRSNGSGRPIPPPEHDLAAEVEALRAELETLRATPRESKREPAPVDR